MQEHYFPVYFKTRMIGIQLRYVKNENPTNTPQPLRGFDHETSFPLPPFDGRDLGRNQPMSVEISTQSPTFLRIASFQGAVCLFDTYLTLVCGRKSTHVSGVKEFRAVQD